MLALVRMHALHDRRVIIGLIVLAVIVVMLTSLVARLESLFVFFPSAGEDVNPGTLGIRYERVVLTTPDGERLIAWQLEPERPVADVVFFHGNGGNLSVWLPVLASLHQKSLRVLAVDYRGYGGSTGAPSERGLYLDAEATVKHAQRNRSPGEGRPLVYWGRSIGGAVAAAATRIAAPDGLILESTFPDKAAVIRHQPILRALNVFASYRFATVESLRGFSKPVLVMHGDRDSIIPFALGRELYDKLGGQKQFATIRDGDHNDDFGSNAAYWDPVMAFITALATSDGTAGSR